VKGRGFIQVAVLSVGTRVGTEAGRSSAPKPPGLYGKVGSFAARPPWDRSGRCRPVGTHI
jgi:hypothetical protein